MNAVTTIVIAVVASEALFQFIQFLISRRDKKKDKTKDILKRLDTLEKDGIRNQLLLLILLRPEEHQEILTIAEHYFKVLHGDWYMTSIFNKWLTKAGIAEPDWFNTNG